MRSIHEKYGHVGIGKCMDRIQRCSWFPDMKGKVSRFIRNCLKCIYNSVLQIRNDRNLYNIEKKPVPFDTLHIDHFGPLPSIRSNRRMPLRNSPNCTL